MANLECHIMERMYLGILDPKKHLKCPGSREGSELGSIGHLACAMQCHARSTSRPLDTSPLDWHGSENAV